MAYSFCKGRGQSSREYEIARYLISFDHGAMDHIPDEEGPAVRDASLAVIRDASAKVVAPDGTITDGAENNIAGVTIIDVPSLEEALQWAARLAVALRCAQEVREFAPVPAVGN